jgi:hypothetical protein
LTETEAVELAAKKYTTMRKPRVEYILQQAQKMAGFKKKKGVIGQWFTYLFLKILCKRISLPPRASQLTWDPVTPQSR